MLNVQRLRVLKEVAAQGSFSAAADALSYTQSAVSQAVATLEAETGATLVERDRKGVRPTAAGEALLAHADAIFSSIEAAEADLASILGLRGGRAREPPRRGADPGAVAKGTQPPRGGGDAARRRDPAGRERDARRSARGGRPLSGRRARGERLSRSRSWTRM